MAKKCEEETYYDEFSRQWNEVTNMLKPYLEKGIRKPKKKVRKCDTPYRRTSHSFVYTGSWR